MIDWLEIATPFAYSSRGASDTSNKSRTLRDRIKGADTRLFDQIAAHVRVLVDSGAFTEFFATDVTLIPVPGHTPLAPGARSTAERICIALLGSGLGSGMGQLLVRHTPVPKSAFSRPEDRPRARAHFESMNVVPQLLMPSRLLLVDDVVTRGATLIGAASRLRVDFPDVPLRAFALLRSITDGDVVTIRDPCEGAIELDAGGESRRRP